MSRCHSSWLPISRSRGYRSHPAAHLHHFSEIPLGSCLQPVERYGPTEPPKDIGSPGHPQAHPQPRKLGSPFTEGAMFAALLRLCRGLESWLPPCGWQVLAPYLRELAAKPTEGVPQRHREPPLWGRCRAPARRRGSSPRWGAVASATEGVPFSPTAPRPASTCSIFSRIFPLYRYKC